MTEKQTKAFARMLSDAKKQKAEAISSLYQYFYPRIFAYIYYRVPSRNVAEDLTSDVIVKMVEGISRVKAKNEAQFASWLTRIVKSVIANYYHDRARTPSFVPLDSVENTLEHLCVLTDNTLELQIYLARVFRELTEEQRMVLTAILMMEYDAEFTGDIIGKNANAVRALKHRAIISLRRLLSKEGDDIS